MNEYEKTLVDIARAIVDDHDGVAVTSEIDEDKTIILILSAAPDDMGKIIGKHGKIAKAIRSVMRAAGNRGGDKVVVEIR
jgi:predicted RNA-binding protein YlqC (UPF0109 family)